MRDVECETAIRSEGRHMVRPAPTLADGILDPLVHNAHRIEMRGDSMRKNKGKTNP